MMNWNFSYQLTSSAYSDENDRRELHSNQLVGEEISLYSEEEYKSRMLEK